MVTRRSRAYYAMVSRLRRAGLPFASLVQGSDSSGCEIVLTTAEEAPFSSGVVMTLEGLDEDPEVFKGQIVSKLEGAGQGLRVGVDPGTRIGFAVFYGETRLAAHTYTNPGSVAARVASFSAGLPSSELTVRIGNGEKDMAKRVAELVHKEAPRAKIELVDESGTSSRRGRTRGIPLDQTSASRIAFRKGSGIYPQRPRTRG